MHWLYPTSYAPAPCAAEAGDCETGGPEFPAEAAGKYPATVLLFLLRQLAGQHRLELQLELELLAEALVYHSRQHAAQAVAGQILEHRSRAPRLGSRPAPSCDGDSEEPAEQHLGGF